MQFLRNLKIAKKLSVAFAGLIGITLVMAALLYLAMMYFKIADKEALHAQQLNDNYQAYSETVSNQQKALIFFMLTGDRDGLKEYEKLKKQSAERLPKLAQNAAAWPEIAKLISEIDQKHQVWVNNFAEKQVVLMRNYLTVNEARAIEASGAPRAAISAFEDVAHKLSTKVGDVLIKAEQKKAQADQWFSSTLGGAIVGIIVAGVYFGYILTNALAGPIGRMTRRMTELADGNLDIDIRGTDRKDELGDMARAVQVFKDNAIKQREMQAHEAQQQERERQRSLKMNELTKVFNEQMDEGLHIVSIAVDNVSSSSQTMAQNAQQTETLSQSASAAIEETNANIQTVSSATTELSASINEISRQMTQTAEVSRAAVEEVDRTTTRVQALNDAAESIGQVIQIISDIAEQTNLLALNATIESARAGDAGKGFAVVANEVKNLAGQTGRATEEISRKISEIQNETSAAADAVLAIGETIRKIDELTTVVVSAIEEQGAATSEIARNVEEAAQGTNEVSSVVQTVSTAADETGTLANGQLDAVSNLALSSDKLKADINTFLTSIKNL